MISPDPIIVCDNCRRFAGCDRFRTELFRLTQSGTFDILQDRIAEDCRDFAEKTRAFRRAA